VPLGVQRIQSCLCQVEGSGRVDRSERWLGVALWLVREWLFRSAGVQGLCPATRDGESFPGCPPGPSSSAGGVGEELAIDPVAHPSFQRSVCFFAGLAFGLFAQLVGASGRVVRDLGDRGDVQRVVQLAVPTWVESVTNAWTRRGLRMRRSSAAVRVAE
jgi:hypothetical protein